MKRSIVSDAPTLASELNAFLADARGRRGLRAHTITSYRCDIQAAAVAMPQPLDAIATTAIETFLMSRDEQPSTTNRRIASVRQFFRWAVRQGLCDHTPLDVVEAKRADTALPRPIHSSDAVRALDAAIAAAPQPYRLIITMLRETGMRADEVLSLNVADVGLDAGREGLRVTEAKNSTERIVVLTPDMMPKTLRGLRAWLRMLGMVAPTTPRFRSNRGTRVSYDALHYRWAQICAAAGLVDVVNGVSQPRYTMHQLRHTVGSTLVTQYPEQMVSRMLGHRDPRSTRRYAEVTAQQVRAALARKPR